MQRLRTLVVTALAATAALAVAPVAVGTAAPAPRDVMFPCAVTSATTCLITIQLTSNMNEQIGSVMPNRNENWWNSEDGGSTGTGGYTLSGPGNPSTTWNGSYALLVGQVWSAALSTGTVSAGAYATLTFSVVPGKRYTSISVTYPLQVATGSPCTITAVVRPVPLKGHLILQRRNGTTWVYSAGFLYVPRTKRWSSTFHWPYGKHVTKVFRVEATPAPGLLATPSAPFHISTFSAP